MEKWKEPASLGSCVWQNEAPSALFGKYGEWKAAGRETGFKGRKDTEGEKEKSSFETGEQSP